MKTTLFKHASATKRFWLFVLLAYGLSWLCWLPIRTQIKANLFESDARVLTLFFLGAYGPTLAALLMSVCFDGRQGLCALLKRLVAWRQAKRWYLVALLVGPLLYGLALGLYAISGGDLGSANLGLLPWIPVVIAVSLLLGPLAEELGWRGYALPCLNLQKHFVLTNLLMGAVWAFWHAPLFWAATGTAISGFEVSATTLGLFVLAVIGASFIYSWVFQRTSGSVLMAVLIHMSMNASGTVSSWLFPEVPLGERQQLYFLYVAVLWALVLGVGLTKIYFRRTEMLRSSSHPATIFSTSDS